MKSGYFFIAKGVLIPENPHKKTHGAKWKNHQQTQIMFETWSRNQTLATAVQGQYSSNSYILVSFC